jgi:uncharacterized BrkB/YihY/UPF0761 family membrane protein
MAEVEPRGLRQQIAMSVAMMGLYAVLTSLSVLASVLAPSLMWISERVAWFHLSGFVPIVGWLVALGSAISMFAALYRVIPNPSLPIVGETPVID